MEVTKRFLWFLQELDDPMIQDQYMSPELNEYLYKIKEKVNKLTDSERQKGNPQVPSGEDLHLLEQSIVENCNLIYTKVKDAIDHLCHMHVYLTNFPLDSLNLVKFLNLYCTTIYESVKISLLSLDNEAPAFLKTINGEQIGNEANHKDLIEELALYMGNEEVKAVDLDCLPLLSTFFDNTNYIGNVVMKLNEDSKPFYIFLHFSKEAQFTGYFMSGDNYKTCPLILGFISKVVNTVLNKNFTENKAIILEDLETIMVDIIQLQKNHFLSSVASEVQTVLCCNVPTSLNILEDEPTAAPRRTVLETSTKSIEIVFLAYNRLEIRANFSWDNAHLNTQLSAIWGKLQNLSKVQEERNYYRTQLKTTSNLFLQFSQKGMLIFQSDVLPEEYTPLIEINNFLLVPTARSMNVVLSKQKKFLIMIQDLVKSFEESKSLLVHAKDVEFENLNFKLVCKRNEWSKTLEGFCIIFDKPTRDISRVNSGNIEKLLIALENNNEDKSHQRLKGSIKKVKAFLGGHQPTQDTKILFGENVDLEKLKKTIVSEYLPDELTRTNSNIRVVSKAISTVRKIKIEMTPKSVFRQVSETNGINRNVSVALALGRNPSAPLVETKAPEKFTEDVLVAQRKDVEGLLEWSFDLSAIKHHTEKSRIVWLILNQTGLIKDYDIDTKKLCEFINRVREGYMKNNNPYHNYDHGVSVMHATHFILKTISTRFTSLVDLGLLISSFCHDIDHTGRTNLFEVNSSSELALIYHDRAVLEQHHAAVTFRILNKESSNIFSNIKPEDRKELRKVIIANILATDMKEHFEMMKNFRELNNRIKAAEEDQYNFTNEDVQLLSGMIIHCADLSGATKDFSLALKWSVRVNEEFSTQVREEAALGIPITPYFKDLDKKHVMAKQEIAFISFMVKPLWELFNDFTGGAMSFATENIANNLKEWNNILDSALKELEDENKGTEGKENGEKKN